MDSLYNDRWTETDSAAFLRYGHLFVPDREVQLQTVVSLLPTETENSYVVDICCGEGLLSRAVLEASPDTKVIALDGSDDMLRQTREQLSSFPNRYQTQRIDVFADDWRTFDQPVQAFVSSLAIHHLDVAEKAQLFADLYQQLEAGGALIVADLVLPENEYGKQLAARQWDRAVMQRSLHYEGDLRGFEAFRQLEWNSYDDPNLENDPVDKLSTLRQQLAGLEEAGFSAVDVFWMNAGHAVFGGYKP